MKFSAIVEWLKHPWLGTDEELAKDYLRTFNSPPGQRVLQHLIDNVYCTVYEGSDPIACVTHNARRSVVHEILETIEHARKAETPPQEDNSWVLNGTAVSPMI